MPASPKPLTVTPSEGGRLVTARSLESVGPGNYAAKVNLRRVAKDSEGRREGWKLFRGNAGLPQGVQAVPTGDRITLIAECVRPNKERAIFAASKTTIYKYNFADGDWDVAATGLSAAGKRWQAVPLNGYLILNNDADLPYTCRAEDATAYPIHELRENGIARVRHIIELNGILQCYDVMEIKASELNGVMNGLTPYGPVADNLCNRVHFRCIWGEIGEPRKWAPAFTVTMGASSATITLPFPSQVFVAGQTRVAVINGGPGGGVLGGQTGYEDGILVTAVAGNVLTLQLPTNASLSYPRDVTIMRWEDQSTIAGRYDLQDDASEVRAVKKLGTRVQIYRENSIFRSTYTGDVDAVFEFRRVLGTFNVPTWSEAIVEVGEYHLYPVFNSTVSNGHHFFMFDGSNTPVIHDVCEDAKNIFFDGIAADSDAFGIFNPHTDEAWFCRPGKVMAYDGVFNTVSEIDAEIHAACFIYRPNSSERWFTLAIEGNIFTYGGTFLRNGVNPGGRMLSGLIHWGDRYGEKSLYQYVVHLASGTAAPSLRIKLLSTYDERVAPAVLLNEVVAGGDYAIPTLYSAMFLQDEISIDGGGDIDVRITGRTFDRAPINSKSTPRRP